MSEPREKSEQIRAEVFPVDVRIALYFESSTFDKVWTIDKEGKVVPKSGDLHDICRNNIKAMKRVLTRFKFNEQENIISLENSPGWEDVK